MEGPYDGVQNEPDGLDSTIAKKEWDLLTGPEIRYLLLVLGLLASLMPWWYVVNFYGGGLEDRTTLLGCLLNIDSTGLRAAAIFYYLGLATLTFKKVRWTSLGAVFLLSSFIVGFYSCVGLFEGFSVYIGGAQYLGFFVFVSMLVIVYARYEQKGLRF